MQLRFTEELQPLIEAVLSEALPRLRALCPQAEIEHVGGTSLPGALTKGDLDVVLRVEAPHFLACRAVLAKTLGVRQEENWTSEFASFGTESAYALPLGVQLVVKDSTWDVFVFLRERLRAEPEHLAIYNRLKLEQASVGAEAYWAAKHRFFSALLASRKVP